MCVRVRACKYMHMRTHTCGKHTPIYVWVYGCTCVSVSKFASMNVFIDLCLYLCTSVCLYASMVVCVCLYVCSMQNGWVVHHLLCARKLEIPGAQVEQGRQHGWTACSALALLCYHQASDSQQSASLSRAAHSASPARHARQQQQRKSEYALRELSGFCTHHCRLAIAHAMAIAHLSLVGLDKFGRLLSSGPGAPAHDAQMIRQQHQHCEHMQRFCAPSPHREHLVSHHLCTESSCSPSRAPAASTIVLPVGPDHRLA